MKKSRFFIYAFFLMVLGFGGCKKPNKVVAPEDFPNTPQGNFEAFWRGMSRYYAFWEYDPTNWDAVFEKYKSKVTDTTSDFSLAKILQEMIAQLVDHHFLITGTIDDTINFQLAPEKVIQNFTTYHGLLDESYFTQILFNQLDANDRDQFNGFVYGTLNGKYQYIHFPQFNITNWAGFNPSFLTNMMNFMAQPKPFHKGVIIDLRTNSGGSSDEISLLVGHFIKETLEYGSIKVKTGPNRNDFTLWMPEKVYPSTFGYNSLPIVVLCDQLTGSNGELSTMAFSLLPNCKVVGTTTFGAFAAVAGPYFRNFTYAGTFFLPNGWKIQTGTCVFRFKDGKVYEGVGFPPDVYLPFDENLFLNNGEDNQLNKAIELLPQ